MRLKWPIFLFLVALGFNSTAQQTWFNRLPRFISMKTHGQGDTLLTFGVSLLDSTGYVITMNYSDVSDGELFYTDTIDLSPLLKLNKTELSYYSPELSVQRNGQWEIGLGYVDSVQDKTEWRAGIFGLNPRTMPSIDLSHLDNWSEVCQYTKIGGDYYAIIRWVLFYGDRLSTISHKLIKFKESGDTVVVKHQVNDECTRCLKHNFKKVLGDNQSDKHLFLIGDNDVTRITTQGEITKIDTSGNTIWREQVTAHDTFVTRYFGAVQKPNGNLLCYWNNWDYSPFMGPNNYYLNETNTKRSIWMAEMDGQTGDVIWRKSLRGFINANYEYVDDVDSSHSISIADAKLVNNSLILAGWRVIRTGKLNYTKQAPVVIKTDFNGNGIWYREHNIYPDSFVRCGMEVHSMEILPDSGILLTGEYFDVSGKNRGALLKLDKYGCFQPGCQKNEDTISQPPPPDTVTLLRSKIYPNPVNEELTIELPGELPENWQISMIDLLGKTHWKYETQGRNFTINTKHLSSGIYMLRLQQKNTNHFEIHKVVIQH